MAEITLVAETGRSTGSRECGRLRRAGKIPAVIYGHGTNPLPVAVEGRRLRAALTTDAGLNALLSLDVDGETLLTLAREIQRHPVRNTVTHVDFQIVRRDEVVSADVPITLVGEAHQVVMSDGVIEHQLFSLNVQAIPELIPNILEVDISAMSIGDAIRVGDLVLPEGVATDVDPDASVVIAQGSAVAAEMEAIEEAEEAEAAAAETAAEGAAEAAEAGGGEAATGGGAAGGGRGVG
jgi:large subunit ribosomal protein L25